MTTRFTVTRSNGRSNAQVVIDFVKSGDAGTVYTYEQLSAALSADASRPYEVNDVQTAVRAATNRLLKEQQRALHNVRGIGYRLAAAGEHSTLAHSRERRAHVQMKQGLALLKNVRWGEMDASARQAHTGHLMLSEALVANQLALEKRMRKVESAIAKLTK